MSHLNYEKDRLAEWREYVGQQVMFAMTCTHDGDEFGQRAVCVTCFANTQRIGALVERLAALAWDQGRDAERRDWELTADLSAPDEGRQPRANPYRALPPFVAASDAKGEKCAAAYHDETDHASADSRRPHE
jgi:hypothetical protein